MCMQYDAESNQNYFPKRMSAVFGLVNQQIILFQAKRLKYIEQHIQ